MATARKSRSKNGHSNNMVNLDSGTISREIFVSPEIYAQEQEQLFARAWLFIGHESQSRVHDRRLTRRARTLNDNRQRIVGLARGSS